MLKTSLNTNSSKNNFVLGQWENALHKSGDKAVQNALWPSSADLYHPWNLVFAYSFQTAEQLQSYPVLLLRDGALSLLDFFFRFPVPPEKASRLIVQADLTFLVPKAWQANCYAYRIKENRDFEIKNSLIFYAQTTNSYLNWAIFKKQIEPWLASFSKKAKVGVYFTQRAELFEEVYKERMVSYELFSELQSYFKEKIQLLNVAELKSAMSKEDVTYINLDLYRSAVAMCSIDSHMMSGLCQIYPRSTYEGFQGTEIDRRPVSFKHDLILYEFKASHQDFLNLYFDYKISKSTKGLPFPIVPTLGRLLQERLSLGLI